VLRKYSSVSRPLFVTLVLNKIKVFPVHPIKSYVKGRGIAPLFLNVDCGWR